MSIKLEDYEDFLKDAAPEIRDVLDSTFQEASRVMSPLGLQIYMDGAKSLCNLGRGHDVVISYIQEMPLVAKECGEDVIGDCLTAALKLSSMTSAEVVSLLFASMPTAALNCNSIGISFAQANNLPVERCVRVSDTSRNGKLGYVCGFFLQCSSVRLSVCLYVPKSFSATT